MYGMKQKIKPRKIDMDITIGGSNGLGGINKAMKEATHEAKEYGEAMKLKRHKKKYHY